MKHSDKRHEDYLLAVQAYVLGEAHSLQSFLKSDASLAEKNLIEARLAMKKNDFDRAQALLDRTHPTTSLLMGERFFLQAGLASFKSRWQEAVVFAMQALIEYKACESLRGLFLANYNLSAYYNRLGLDELSVHFINEAENYARTPSQVVLINRARACALTRIGDHKSAVQQIEKALSRIDQLDSVDSANLRAIAADVYFRAGEMYKALQSLNELQRTKNLPEKARIKFDLTLLSALVAQLEIYVPSVCPEIFETNIEYKLKWQLISALQDGQWTRAESAWKEISTIMPTRYLPEFKCAAVADENTVFMTVVRKLLSRTRTDAKFDCGSLTGKQLLLYKALTESKIPLRKEDLIEKIWACEYDPSYDARFYKLIERFKSSTGQEIEVVRHTYRLK